MSEESELIKTQSGITLTSHRVFHHAKNMFFEEEISIPLSAIAGIGWGWTRQRALFYVGIVLAIAGVVLGAQGAGGGASTGFLGVAFVVLIVFWVWKETVVEVHSAKVSIKGRIMSEQEAQAFVVTALKELRKV